MSQHCHLLDVPTKAAAVVVKIVPAWFAQMVAASHVIAAVLIVHVQVERHIIHRRNMAILRGFPPSNTIYPTTWIFLEETPEAIEERRRTMPYLTEEEVQRAPDYSFQISCKIVGRGRQPKDAMWPKNNFWLDKERWQLPDR